MKKLEIFLYDFYTNEYVYKNIVKLSNKSKHQKRA